METRNATALFKHPLTCRELENQIAQTQEHIRRRESTNLFQKNIDEVTILLRQLAIAQYADRIVKLCRTGK